jgi:ketosteroid isomerase-like protein
MSGQSDEARAALLAFLFAFENLDWDAFRVWFASDVSVFFPSPEPCDRFDGREAVEAQFAKVFEGIRKGARTGPPYHRLEPVNLLVEDLDAGLALATFELVNPERMARRTVVFKKTSEGWRIAHLHASNASPAQSP